MTTTDTLSKIAKASSDSGSDVSSYGLLVQREESTRRRHALCTNVRVVYLASTAYEGSMETTTLGKLSPYLADRRNPPFSLK